MEQYKKQIEEIAFSDEVTGKIEAVGNKYSLMIDQLGELAAETRDIITGSSPSQNFLEHLKKRLEISTEMAQKIAADINTDVLQSIKETLRKIQDEKDKVAAERPPITPKVSAPPLTPIEKVGNFNVVRPPVSASPLYNDHSLDKDAVLHDLENIQKLRPENANNFVEHLLANPVPPPPKVEVKKPLPPVPPRKDGVDPYREQF